MLDRLAQPLCYDTIDSRCQLLVTVVWAAGWSCEQQIQGESHLSTKVYAERQSSGHGAELRAGEAELGA